MTITQERIDAIKEDCNQAIAYGRAKKGMDAHATLPANDVLAIIEEVEKLRKQTGWNFNVDEAPRDGTLLVVLDDIGHVMTAYADSGPFQWKSDDYMCFPNVLAWVPVPPLPPKEANDE